MPIETSSYDSDNLTPKRPLLIGCSGGGGHNTAIQGIRDFLYRKYADLVQFISYAAIKFTDKNPSLSRTTIKTGSVVMNDFYILSPTIKAICHTINFPLLPKFNALQQEICKLEKNNVTREYIDMLLDAYPAGYESAAIWNVLQQTGKTDELKKLINMQNSTDKENYGFVYRYFSEKLNNEAARGTPYTEIISTNAQGLPALCDAVKAYNKRHPKNPQIIIHQYMTDLPSQGAVHFFNQLATLQPDQQKLIKLYGLGMKQDVLDYFFPVSKGYHFKGIYNIPAHENPMIRAGFNDSELNHSKAFNDHDVTIALKDEEKIKIKKDEQIASIMLGSQASHDTVGYIEALLENSFKVFVFGGKTDVINQKINSILVKHPEYKSKIIRLSNQGDREIVPLMTRSNLVIIRGGGLSVMEQMAMSHHKCQTVFIHHAKACTGGLTSGISWEDDNATTLIHYLHTQDIHAEKTSPEQAKQLISKAVLLAAANGFQQLTTNEIGRYINDLHPKQLEKYVTSLKEDGPQHKTKLFEYLDGKIQCEMKKQENQENKIKDIICSLLIECNLCKEHLTNTIAKESGNIEQAIKDAEENEHKKSTVDRYRAIQRLLLTLANKENTLPSKQLHLFKNEYEKPETKRAFFYNNDNFIMKFIKELNYLLSKIYVVNYVLGLDKFFTPDQKIRRHMENTNPNEKHPSTRS